MLKAKKNAEQIALFLDICEDRRLSQDTTRTYDTALSDFFDYAGDIDKLFSEMSMLDIRAYKKQNLGQLAPASQNLKLSVVRRFYDTLAEYGEFTVNPVSMSFNNRLEKKAITYVDDKNYKLLEEYFKQHSSDNYVLGLRLMYFSGLRVGEVAAIDLTRDIFEQRGQMYLKVHGKGAKERIVPVFSRAAASQIKSYIASHESLLPLRIGTSTSLYDYHLKQAPGEIDIPVYSCHDFRRGFAVNLYKKTRDLELVRVLLGHESYNTTLMYIRDVTVKIYDIPANLFA